MKNSIKSNINMNPRGGSFINGHLGIAHECCKVATLAEKGTRRARIGHEGGISFFKNPPPFRVDYSHECSTAKREGIAFSVRRLLVNF